jgi:hypothetical protein
MANSDIALGFRAVRPEYGTVPKLETFVVATTEVIYEGAPVCIDDDGEIIEYTDTLAVAGKVMGVAAHYVSGTQTDRELQVYTDVNQEYELQVDDATLASKADSIGRLFQLTNPAAGNSTTLQSTAEIDADTGASVTGVTNSDVTPVRIERESEQINNEKNVAFSRYIVRFIPGVMLRGLATIGIGATETIGN